MLKRNTWCLKVMQFKGKEKYLFPLVAIVCPQNVLQGCLSLPKNLWGICADKIIFKTILRGLLLFITPILSQVHSGVF